MIGPLLRIAVTSIVGARGIRAAANDAATRAALTGAAGVGGAIAMFCFTHAGLTVLERHMDPAEAWSAVGGLYGVLGGALYFAANTKRGGKR